MTTPGPPSPISEALDRLVAALAASVPGARVTRDPSLATPPVVLVGAPTVAGFGLRGLVLTVPIWAIGKSPAGLPELDWIHAAVTAILAGPVVVPDGFSPDTYRAGTTAYPALRAETRIRI